MNYKPILLLVTATIFAHAILCGCSAPPSQTSLYEPTLPPPTPPQWTTNETERYWTFVADNATRLSFSPRSLYLRREFVSRALSKDLQNIGREELSGEGMLEAFGNQYMPNAYEYYEKIRISAKEKIQALKENFPNGVKSDSTGGGLFYKVAKASAKAVSEYYRRRDELCHFYLMHKAGILTDAELAHLDEAKICIMLPKAQAGDLPEAPSAPSAPSQAELDFARKYKPETFAAYERLRSVFNEGVKNYEEILQDARILDAIRGGWVLEPLRLRLVEIGRRLGQIARILKEEKLIHSVGDISIEQLAESDSKMGLEMKTFEKKLPIRQYGESWCEKNWTMKEWAGIAFSEGFTPKEFLYLTMVDIPDMYWAEENRRVDHFLLCKFKVSQGLWTEVMHYNNSIKRGSSLPVTDVSRAECEEFINRLNSSQEVRSSGYRYRLPTRDEWTGACSGGFHSSDHKDNYAVLQDGWTKYSTLNEEERATVAWLDNECHPIGEKKPTAFGLYDMISDISEFIADDNEITADIKAIIYEAGHIFGTHDTHPQGRNDISFRLAADKVEH